MIFQGFTIYNRYNLTLNLGMHFTPYIIQENENLIYDVNFFCIYMNGVSLMT
jgi:hypothetical protein